MISLLGFEETFAFKTGSIRSAFYDNHALFSPVQKHIAAYAEYQSTLLI